MEESAEFPESLRLRDSLGSPTGKFPERQHLHLGQVVELGLSPALGRSQRSFARLIPLLFSLDSKNEKARSVVLLAI